MEKEAWMSAAGDSRPDAAWHYLQSRWRGPATPPTYLPSEAVKIYMYGRLVA